jgi:two-component system CheB/CheR fusion protein
MPSRCARAAFYPEAIATDVSSLRLRRFFAHEAGGYRVQKSIRERVMFATHDVLRDAPFSRPRPRQLPQPAHLPQPRRAVAGAQRLPLRAAHGRLPVPGSSESVDEAASAFSTVDKPNRIFRAEPQTARITPLLYVPSPSSVNARAGNPGGLQYPATRGQLRSGLGDLHLNLLEHYAPPSVVVNDLYQIVHLSDNGRTFPSVQRRGAVAEPRAGRAAGPARRAARGVVPGVADRRAGHPRRADPRDDKSLRTRLTIHPVPDQSTGRLYLLVIFDEQQVDEAVSPDRGKGVAVSEQLESSSPARAISCATPSSSTRRRTRSSRPATRSCRRSTRSCARRPRSSRRARKSSSP